MTDTYEFLKAQKDAILAKREDDRWEWLDAATADTQLAAARQQERENECATIAGHQSAINHLSALFDEQYRLLEAMEEGFGRDGHGGRLEDGESELVDRVRAHLAAFQPTNADITNYKQRITELDSRVHMLREVLNWGIEYIEAMPDVSSYTEAKKWAVIARSAIAASGGNNK